MIESREVVIFKAEVELFKQKYTNKNFSSTNNQYTNSVGTPIYDVNNPDEKLHVLICYQFLSLLKITSIQIKNKCKTHFISIIWFKH